MSDATELLLPRWIATVEPGEPVLTDHALLICGERIAALGPRDELLARHRTVPRRDLPDTLVCPGFVNAHTHAAMSLMRGFADDLPLHDWLQKRIWPAEGRCVSPDFVYDGTILAGYEMLLGGTTCFNDMYFFPEQTTRAAQTLGMRAQIGIIVIDFPSPYGSGPDDYLRKGLALRDAQRGDPLLSFALAPHAPYTVSDDTFRSVTTLADELQLPVHVHLHETAFEVEDAVRQHGQRPFERLERLGLIGPSLMAVHAVHMNAQEIELLAARGASVVHCPHSNLKLGSGIAPVGAMLAAGVNLAIGTDGSASNNRLDLLQETRTAALLAKGASANAAMFPAQQALHAMTLGSARAIGLEEHIGSLRVGKQADLVAVDLKGPEMQPVFEPISQLIYAADRRSISHVWVAGKCVVEAQQLREEAAQQAVSEVVGRIPLWQNEIGEFFH
ncbi:MAG: TRZ/ATZ family hydrolase [Burkholderiaceae bacterium]